MSDLSSPPPSLVPSEAGGGEAPAAFAWPTPPLACYPVPQPLAEPEPCQIEGLNGKLMNGALLGFDPDAGIAQVRIPPARIAMPLRFGQFRRLTLARALAPDPAILVADEPTGNLDEATGKQIVDLLFSKHTERGMTLVLVTHDSALAQRCDRVVRLRSGRIDGHGA